MSNLEPLVKIGNWYYQAAYGQLWSADTGGRHNVMRLEPRLHSLLNFLLLHPNQLLTKDTLIDKVWPAGEGTDAAVMRAIGALRRILDDDVRAPRYIATISKKGYCWLAEIEPQTSNHTDEIIAVSEKAAGIEAARKPASWRFVVAVVFCLLSVTTGLAYFLATYTAVPLTRLPDLIKPVSALPGMEYWPLADQKGEYVAYQHQPPGTPYIYWATQDLQSLKVTQDTEAYLKLSEAVWHDTQHIVFRAVDLAGNCGVYQKQILPVSAPAKTLFSCQHFVSQGLQYWQQQLVWIDHDEHNGLALWRADINGIPELLHQLPSYWLTAEHLQVQHNTLYLLADRGFFSTELISVSLDNGHSSVLQHFPFNVNQLSLWDERHLLLADQDGELLLFDLRSAETLRLGLLTRQLTQARRYQHRILATQLLDYKTDILQLQFDGQHNRISSLQPWQISNRSESLVAGNRQQLAFVTERSGYNQIWLTDGADSRQLTQLKDKQQVQQLLWHDSRLLALINNQLYEVNRAGGELTLYHRQNGLVGRYQSCNEQLYWTEYDEQLGWQLMQMTASEEQAVILQQVLDVRCAPVGLIVQRALQQPLAWWHQGSLQPLAAETVQPEADPYRWLTDIHGIYWLDAASHGVRFLPWGMEQSQLIKWPDTVLPVALYDDGEQLRYVVRPRAYDTDVVWLQNR